MNQIKLKIDGLEATVDSGQTILDAAKSVGVSIPTLCHDRRVEMYGACGICVVECEGIPKLLRACSTAAAEGMAISTDTARIRENRKTVLELLLSDHTGDCRAPCTLACPGDTDCQGYVGLIANGEYKEAARLIKEKLPFPASIGRVCPHPCEAACRRELVEEPIAIAALKQFVGDFVLQNSDDVDGDVAQNSGKSVAVIGGGPGGLTAAYFLRQKGHDVTVLDAMPKMGGMLRYGIPQYRLPKDVLQAEIDLIEKSGVKLRNNTQVGRDVTLQQLRDTYDAVIIAAGAWRDSGLRCPGEELPGVMGGIGFLLDVATGKTFSGKRVAVVGGGNTAMDVCRTAVRMGAEQVYNIYRRTKNEMPAEDIEIKEAQEEGVIFKNLTNPLEILEKDGKVGAVRLQIMELGEPDSSGRRAPVPVAGEEETIEVDTVICAIGQKLNSSGFEDVELTKWGTIAADENTCRTSIDGVFAVGDATNDGAGIAIAAIGEGKRAADMAHRHLSGEAVAYSKPYLVESEKTAEDFADRAKSARMPIKHREPCVRKKDFDEVNLPLRETDVKAEAARCLECGCADYFECKLLKYANDYAVEPQKYSGATHSYAESDNHPNIRRNAEKCILCGLCVRTCEEVVGAGALGLIDRGFDAVVKPALDSPLAETTCISCGQCVAVCPTGALTEAIMLSKQVPLDETFFPDKCSRCEIGCKTKVAKYGELITRILPAEEDGLLCRLGRFSENGDLIDTDKEIELQYIEKIAKQNGYTGELPKIWQK